LAAIAARIKEVERGIRGKQTGSHLNNLKRKMGARRWEIGAKS
jgi:hypothetical protein